MDIFNFILLFYSKPPKTSQAIIGHLSDGVHDIFIHLGLIIGVK